MDTILFHASCQDGFGAAFAAWLKLGKEAQYIPVQYGKEPPPLGPCEHLYIFDFSYPRETLLTLGEQAKQVIVLDHHKTAEADLKDLTSVPHLYEQPDTHGVYAWFDQRESGATLAWYFFHRQPVPEFFRLLRDRDLWLWELDESREFSAGLASYPYDFQLWQNFLNHEDEIDRLKSDGDALLRGQEQRVDRAQWKVRWVDFAGHHVPCLNTTADISEIGESLCLRYKNAPFSLSFFVSQDARVIWSLRSRNDFDVSPIAKQFGGGGHAQAAGFATDLTFLATLLQPKS